jgi:hypothetical protein
VQVGAPFGGIGQTVPHFPQFEMSEPSATQLAPQGEKPVLQLTPQPVAPQAALPLAGVGQTTLQSPQFLGSALTSTHEPPQFFALPGQLAMQWPPEQTSVLPQVVPHAPQLLGSLSVLTQAPPHLAKPGMQVLSHAPSRQMGMPFAGASHTLPHAPQFCGSVMVSMQLDRHGEKPGSQATLHLAEVHTPLP